MQRRLLALIPILLIGAALRLHNIEAASVWFDEGWSAHAAAQTTIRAAAVSDATNPPIYYALINITARFTGMTEFGLRWLSFALGMVGVALAARLGRVFGPVGAVGAAWAATLSLPLIWAAQEMRMYTLLAVFVTVAAIAWTQLRSRPSRGAWVLLLAAELAILYAHNTGPVVVLWLNLVTLCAWLIDRKLHLLRWIAGQAIVAALYAPYFISRFLLLTDANSALVRRTALTDLRLWVGLWLAPWEALSDLSVITLAVTVLPLIVLLPALAHAQGHWLAVHSLTLIAGLWFALAVLGNEMHGRYLVMLIPLLAALIGGGIATLPNKLRYGGAILIVLPLLIGYNWLTSPAHTHDDARGMTAHYTLTLDADDTVLAWSYADRYELAYYWPRQDVSARRVTLPEGAPLDEIQPLLPTSGDVSLNVWFTQRADYRGMADCLLAHGTTSMPEVHTVNGMATRTYRAPELAPPEIIETLHTVEVGTIVSYGRLPDNFTANQAICLPISLMLERVTTSELKVAVIVTDANGVEITSTSSVFATPNNRTSADNALGERLTAFPVIRMPSGTPPGDYTISIRAFDTETPSGYDVLQNGAPFGKEAPLGTWTVVPGADWHPEQEEAFTLADIIVTPEEARSGDTLQVALTWHGTGNQSTLPDAILRADDGSWSVVVPATVRTFDDRLTEYRLVQLPLDAPTGEAVLSVDDFGAVARVSVAFLPLITEPPDIENPVGVGFPGLGELIGYSITEAEDNVISVTLLWRATNDAPPNRDLTVFVQFLNGGGDLIAQSDAKPAGGSRPTVGWRPGEYIEDTHQLTLPADTSLDTLTLIAGLYDADGRLTTANDTDAVVLSDGES